MEVVMPDDPLSLVDIRVKPVTPELWTDLEALFSTKGACNDCWCMFWRIGTAVYGKQTTQQHHDGLRALVDSGHVPGLLAYVDGQIAGWCAVGPRSDFQSIERSTVLKRVDDLPVWSVPCFFVDRQFRGRGVMRALIESAIAYAATNGATLIESYPTPSDKKVSSSGASKGVQSAFSRAGFVEVKRAAPSHIIMRYSVDGSGTGLEGHT
jgi:GNAT superfamily N-acetyltransferase